MKKLRMVISISSPLLSGILLFVLAFVIFNHITDIKIFYNRGTTPWGVLTSIFVYDGSSNIIAYGEGIILFYLTIIGFNRRVWVRRSKFLTLNVFSVAVITNIIWLAGIGTRNSSYWTYGQSGVVYSLIGTVLAFSSIDTFFHLMPKKAKRKSSFLGRWAKGRAESKSRRIFSMVIEPIIAMSLLFLYFLDFPVFLSVAPGTNSLIHVLNFIIALIVTGLWVLISK